MVDNELIKLVDSIDTNESIIFSKKLQILGVRKSIIVIFIIDFIINIVTLSLINPYYIFTLISSCFIMYGLLNFNLFFSKLELYHIISILIFKCILVFCNISILSRFFIIISIFSSIFLFKLVSKFYIFINNNLSDDELESLQSGWQPRNIPFAF